MRSVQESINVYEVSPHYRDEDELLVTEDIDEPDQDWRFYKRKGLSYYFSVYETLER